jgi:uncharacterized membrane protein (DUF4010 family)
MDSSAVQLLVRDFAIALFIGALVGLEREKKKAAAGEAGLAGIRTFILTSMAGAVSAWLSQNTNVAWVFPITFLAVAGLVMAGYVITVQDRSASPGLTTEIAALVVFLLGGTVMFGYPVLAVALGIATSAILAFKEPLHGFVEKVGRDDILAGLKLLTATFIVLPLLPNSSMGPLDALNPYKLWWLVILISGLGLVGYVAVRILGQTRGTAVTGIFGGLTSSTAVTLAFSKRSKEDSKALVLDALAAGILLAWLVMFARVTIEVAVVHASLLRALVLPLAAMAVLTLGASLLYLRRGARASKEAASGDEVALKNPFSLTSAIKFAAFFAVILIVVAVARQRVSGTGLYLVAVLAGLTDVDAITLSMANYAKEGGDTAVAVNSITLAALSNTVVKAVMVGALADRGLRRRVVVAAALILAAGLVAILV